MNRVYCDACQTEILDPSQSVTVHARRSRDADMAHYDLCPNCWESMVAHFVGDT